MMKTTLLLTAVQNGARRIPMALIVAAAVTFLHQDAAAITPIDYGAASSFSVLAGSGIGNTGSGTTIGQNVGVSAAGTTITGLLPGQVGGTIYALDASGPAGSTGNNPGLVGNAMSAFGAAYTAAAGETPTSPNTLLQLGGQILIPGVYTFNTIDTVLLDGILTLNGNGEAHPVWIFQMTRDLITGSQGIGSSIVFENGGVPCDVLWRVPTQATLGTDSSFVGTIMAGSAIVMETGATLDGRAWAETAVTLDHNTISGLPCTSLTDTGGTGGTGGTTVPDTGSTLPLLGIGVLSLLAFLKARGRSLGLTQNRRAIS
jgi:hypothetical protein